MLKLLDTMGNTSLNPVCVGGEIVCGRERLCVGGRYCVWGEGIVCESMHINVHILHIHTESMDEVYRACAQSIQRVCTKYTESVQNYIYTLYVCSKKEREG